MDKLMPVYTVELVRSRETPYSSTLRNSKDIAAFLTEYLKGADREHFVVLLLDNKSRVLGINTVSVGSLSASLVHPREVFKPAILANASSVIVAHNHVGRDTSPSDEDKLVTRRLELAGEAIGIRLVDHLIVADDGSFFSFWDQMLIHGGKEKL